MAIHDKYISNTEAIPLTESGIFDANSASRFAVGIISEGTNPPKGYDGIFQNYLRLRANVYIDQTRMLDPSERRTDGTEIDGDDKRSTHIVGLENRAGRTAVVASMRLIQKTEVSDEQLPVEHYFGDEIKDVPINGLEISRYIVRHEERSHAAALRSALFITALSHIVRNDLGPTYAIVEEKLANGLEKGGVPIHRLSDLRMLPKYDDLNQAINIDTAAFASQLGGADNVSALAPHSGEFVYWGNSELEM